MRTCARGSEDIPLLVRHFVHTYAQRLRTRIDTIPADVRDAIWVVGGPQGAAVCLGLKRTTLIYRLGKLGIPRQPP